MRIAFTYHKIVTHSHRSAHNITCTKKKKKTRHIFVFCMEHSTYVNIVYNIILKRIKSNKKKLLAYACYSKYMYMDERVHASALANTHFANLLHITIRTETMLHTGLARNTPPSPAHYAQRKI